MQNKYLRYTAGFLFLSLILLSFYNKWMLFAVSIVFIFFALSEYRNMFKAKEQYICPLLPEIFGILLSYIFIFNTKKYLIPLLIFSIIIAFIYTIIKNKKPYFQSSFITISAIIFVFFGLYIIELFKLFSSYGKGIGIVIYFLSVLAGDFAASKIGSKISSLYITKEISPNKTLAGSFACIITTILLCCFYNIFLDIAIFKCIILGIITSFFAQIGDLTISTIKRDLEIKHSGSLFLDYGGIWDRIDAFLFSAPALYYTLLLLS